MSENLSSAAVVIGALRVNCLMAFTICGNISYFVCVDALHPSHQFFSHVGIFSCLPGLN